MSDATYWRKCSNCKETIGWDRPYWVCSVSTCNQKRTGLVFCSVSCWDAHLPIMRHRDAWAEERRSPKAPNDGAQLAVRPAAHEPRRIVMSKPNEPSPGEASSLAPPPPDEILVVASKVKAYIRARGGLNTSAATMEALSAKVRQLCDAAIRSAVQHERKTVLDRDVS